MYLQGTKRKCCTHSVRACDVALRWLAVLCSCFAVGALGQGVLAPLPGFQDQIAVGQAPGSPWNSETGPVVAVPNPLATPAAEILNWGALHLRPRVTYQVLVGSGIQSSPGQAQTTITHSVSPGLLVQLGPHWSFDYSPSFRFYSDRHFRDTVDHALSLSGGTSYGNWSFGVSQSYSRTDDPQVETAGQTKQQSYSAGLSAAYSFNSKWSLEMSASVGLSFVDPRSVTNILTLIDTNITRTTNVFRLLNDSRSYSTAEWMNYQVDRRIGIALGLSGGYSEQESGFKSVYEQLQGRLTFRPGAKLSLVVSGGVEDRQFLNSKVPDNRSPIFNAALAYQIFEPTTLTLSAGRSVNASLLRDQITESTSLGLGLQQRLLKHLHLSLGFGYGVSDYKSTVRPVGSTNSVSIARSDETVSFNAGLNLAFLKHGNVGTFYHYSRNLSNVGGAGYSSSQVGATLSWAY